MFIVNYFGKLMNHISNKHHFERKMKPLDGINVAQEPHFGKCLRSLNKGLLDHDQVRFFTLSPSLIRSQSVLKTNVLNC